MSPAPAFAPGAPVRVRDVWPERTGPVHLRTPHYLRGVAGRIMRPLGAFPNPEDLAFGRPAATVPLYHVEFEPMAVWPDGERDGSLLVEVFEHWLEPIP